MLFSLLPLFLNLIILFFDIKYKSPFSALSAALLLVFSIPHVYFSLLTDVVDVSVSLYVSLQAVLFFATYFTIFSILRLGFLKFNDDRNFFSTSEIYLRGELKFSLLMMVVFSVFIFASFNFNISKMIFSTWSDFRNETTIYKLVGSFCFYSGSGMLLLAVINKKRLIFTFGILFIIAVAGILKTRSYLIAAMVPIIFYFMLTSRWNIKKIVTLFILSIFLFTLFSSARTFRHAGSIDNLTSHQVGLNPDVGEFELIHTLYFFVDRGGVKKDFEFPTLLRLTLLPFPASMLSFEKPKDLSHQLWDEKTGLRGVSGSLHATLIGDSILQSYKYGAVIFGIIYGMLFFVIEFFFRNLRIGKVLVFSLLCTFCFYVARGAVYNGFVNLVISSFLIFIFYIYVKVKYR